MSPVSTIVGLEYPVLVDSLVCFFALSPNCPTDANPYPVSTLSPSKSTCGSCDSSKPLEVLPIVAFSDQGASGFMSMQKKLDAHEYPNAQAFLNDFKLMIQTISTATRQYAHEPGGHPAQTAI